ncbi:MAG: fasciclin domain-containing protein, partial [Actinomycetota bacterium]
MHALFKSVVAAIVAGAMLIGFAGAAGAQDPDAPSIGETVATNADFSTLGAALDLTGLSGMFTDCAGGPYTVLAPTNDAFASWLEELGLDINDLIGDPELVATVLTYHVVEGAVTSDVVVGLDGASAPTVQGEAVTVAVEGETVSLYSGNPTP